MPTTSASSSQDIKTKTVVIANGAALSSAADLEGGSLVGIYLPTLTSAAISFQVSADGTTYGDFYNSGGTEVTLGAASTGARFCQPPAGIEGGFVKVRSGTTGATVNQGAERTITLLIKVAR